MATNSGWAVSDILRANVDCPNLHLTAGQRYRLLAFDFRQAFAALAGDDGQIRQCPAAMLHLSMPASPAPGIYRHYRGGRYRLLCVARHSETEEWLVAYTSEQTGNHWVRPLSMWAESVDGRPRFRRAEGK